MPGGLSAGPERTVREAGVTLCRRGTDHAARLDERPGHGAAEQRRGAAAFAGDPHGAGEEHVLRQRTGCHVRGASEGARRAVPRGTRQGRLVLDDERCCQALVGDEEGV